MAWTDLIANITPTSNQYSTLGQYGAGGAMNVSNYIEDTDFANDPNSNAFANWGGQEITPQGGMGMGVDAPAFSDLLGGQGGSGGPGGFGSLQGWGSVMGGVGSLMGAWNGMQQMKLAKEQFGVSKALANRNLANQAAVTNQALRDRRSGRRAVFGGNKGTGAQVSGAPV